MVGLSNRSPRPSKIDETKARLHMATEEFGTTCFQRRDSLVGNNWNRRNRQVQYPVHTTHKKDPYVVNVTSLTGKCKRKSRSSVQDVRICALQDPISVNPARENGEKRLLLANLANSPSLRCSAVGWRPIARGSLRYSVARQPMSGRQADRSWRL